MPCCCTSPVPLIYLVYLNKLEKTLHPNDMLKVQSTDWEQQTGAASEAQAALLFSRAVHCCSLKCEIRVVLLPLNDHLTGAATPPYLPSSTAENNLKFSLLLRNGNFAASYEFETTGNFTEYFSYLPMRWLSAMLHRLLWLQIKNTLKIHLLSCSKCLT